MTLTKEQIMEILPHRDPFLFVDEVVEFEPGKRVKAIKHVLAEEPHFKGHFPGHPVMPGVLILEALAQVGGIAVLSLPENRGKLALLGGIKDARFLRQVQPGDELEMECSIDRVRGNVGIGSASARVDGEEVCRGKITFALVGNDGNH